METSPLRTSELAQRAGVNPQSLRYYERRGLLPAPPRSPSGYRLYPPSALRVLRFIKRAQRLGFSLREVEELLSLRVGEGSTCAMVRSLAEEKIADIEAKMRELKTMKAALEELTAACGGRGPASECPILDAMEGVARKA